MLQPVGVGVSRSLNQCWLTVSSFSLAERDAALLMSADACARSSMTRRRYSHGKMEHRSLLQRARTSCSGFAQSGTGGTQSGAVLNAAAVAAAAALLSLRGAENRAAISERASMHTNGSR